MYQDYSGNYDTSSRGSSTSPAQPESFTSGSSTIGSPISTSNYQKYRVDMPGSNSAFIPTINAITTSQDLQWMVQPTVITSMSNPYSRSHPYSHHMTNGPGLLGHNTLARPGVIRSIGDARRRKRDEQLSPEEEEKRRVRRERNKLAAAKCRNRRRELTEMLQGETEKLEEEKADLQKEIETLQKEKDKLEFMLVAHNPVCKLPGDDRHPSGPAHHPSAAAHHQSAAAHHQSVAAHHPSHHHQPHLPPQQQQQQQCAPLPLTMRPAPLPPRGPASSLNPVVVKQEPEDDLEKQQQTQRSVIKPICLGAGGGGVGGVGLYCSDAGDSLNTPVVVASTPAAAATPNTAPSLIFTYPSMMEPESPSPSSESCSKAHRRSSSSGDQSSDSLNSPTLLAL